MTSAPAAVPHVVLVPRRSQGHVNPFISLAHFLAASGLSVTVVLSACCNSAVSSPASSKTDASEISQAPPTRIKLIRPDILPSAAGDADMCRLLEELLQKLKQEHNLPCCLIVDSSLRGLRDVALKFGLPRVVLFTFSAFLVCLWLYMPEMIAKGYIPAVDEESQEKMIDFIPGLSPIRVADLPSRLKAKNGLQSPEFVDLISAFKNIEDADRFLVNTMHELESNVLEALRMESSIVMDPVGPLFKISSIGSSDLSLHQEDKSCLAWLDQQREESVLYISFGSVATIEKDVFQELAYGLEASGESFLWVIRSDAYKEKAMTMEELLPKGFVGRTGDRGLVISWAPQLAVLAHRSVGAFLTHCGWNSVLESLSHGIPMLGFPQEAEQITNLKYVVHDWKVGLPLLEADVHSVDRARIQEAVKAIMKGGTEVRKQALEWRDIANRATHGTSKLNLQKLVDDLKHGHIKPTGA